MRFILANVGWNSEIDPDIERSDTWIEEQEIYDLWEKGPLSVKLNPVQGVQGCTHQPWFEICQ